MLLLPVNLAPMRCLPAAQDEATTEEVPSKQPPGISHAHSMACGEDCLLDSALALP